MDLDDVPLHLHIKFKQQIVQRSILVNAENPWLTCFHHDSLELLDAAFC